MISTEAPAAVSIRGLTKIYGSLAAVRELNLEVRPGEVFGFLGLNGAGKSTTIRILLDLLRATSGQALLFGHDCRADSLQARALVGYLPGELGVYGDLTGRETLDFLAGLSGQTVDQKFRGELQRRLELNEADLRRKIREYSTGMKRKLGLIQAMQGDPPLLILDEPTEGLDPLMREAFYSLLLEAQQRGRTIFMSSHVLSEVERICTRIALLRKGRLVMLSTVDDICKLAPRRVRVLFSSDVKEHPELPAGYEMVQYTPNEWSLRIEGPLGPLLRILADLPVADLRIEESRLEDVVIKYYREDSR